MSDVTLALAVGAWWTFAVVVWLTIIMNHDFNGRKDVAIAICMAVLWPIVAALSLPILIYDAIVKSTKRIRIDLKNRGVLREFEDWLRERKKSEKEAGE